jgi:cytochrome c-type biogenesis protein CcmH
MRNFGLRHYGIVLILLALMVAHPAHAVSDPTEMLTNSAQEARAEEIGSQLRCLVCQNESIEESDALLARDLRRIVRKHVVAGDSDQQIMTWMAARYGDFVCLRPMFKTTTALLWLSPVLALLIGFITVWLSRRGQSLVSEPLSPQEVECLAALDDYTHF